MKDEERLPIPDENPDMEKVEIGLNNPSQVNLNFTNKDVFQTVGGIISVSGTKI